jgi:hypothetical protein
MRKYTLTPSLLLWYFPDLRKLPDRESPSNDRVGSSGTPAKEPEPARLWEKLRETAPTIWSEVCLMVARKAKWNLVQ